VKYAWITKHKTQWPVTLACEVLEVSASGYFEHWRRKDNPKPSKPGAKKRISDEALLVHIRAIHAEVKQEYGQKCGKNWWRVAFEWAKSVSESSCSATA
jgi:putative transposase